MYNIIERYMNKLSPQDIDQFARKNNIFLSSEELNFTFHFVKKNWQFLLNNPNSLNLAKYQNYYSPENFVKIEKLFKEYFSRYKNYL
ncbi:MAG: hypothetical protein HFJ02_05500 [Bacilli bacterium]|nr:hypothetical protein [Bacilli bacterium]